MADGGPQRVQLRRTRGWRKPPGAVVVARPSKWGNPYPVGRRPGEPFTREEAVRLFRDDLVLGEAWSDHGGSRVRLRRVAVTVADVRSALRGRDLCCWCPAADADGRPVACHADVLLEIANVEEAP